MKIKMKITVFVLRTEDLLEKCKISLMKPIKSLDELKTVSSLSLIAFKTITANFVGIWISCNAFHLVTTMPLKVKAEVTSRLC